MITTHSLPNRQWLYGMYPQPEPEKSFEEELLEAMLAPVDDEEDSNQNV